MKRLLIFFFVLLTCLSAQDKQADSTVTRINISDVKYYDIPSFLNKSHMLPSPIA